MDLKRKKYGHLECLEKEGAAGAPTVILLHGFGASQEDLAPLSQAIQAPKGTRWIFPNGPHKVEIGPHMEGRAWYPLSLRELQEAQASGLPLDFSDVTPPGMGKAVKQVTELISSLRLENSKYVIGGFSQGAIVSTEVAMLEKPQQASGLCLLSGTLVSQNKWRELAPNLKSVPVYQSHGKFDQVLPFAGAQKLQQLLTEAGVRPQFREFHGQHEIPSQVLQDLSSFFRAVLN